MLEGYSTVSWGTLLNPPNWSDYTAICLCGSKFQLLISNMIMVINPHFCRVYNFVCPLIVINPFLVQVLIMFQSPSILFPPLEVERDRLGRIGVRETQTPWLDRQQGEILKVDVFLKSWMAMEIAPRTVRYCWWNNSSTSWYGKNIFFHKGLTGACFCPSMVWRQSDEGGAILSPIESQANHWVSEQLFTAELGWYLVWFSSMTQYHSVNPDILGMWKFLYT